MNISVILESKINYRIILSSEIIIKKYVIHTVITYIIQNDLAWMSQTGFISPLWLKSKIELNWIRRERHSRLIGSLIIYTFSLKSINCYVRLNRCLYVFNLFSFISPLFNPKPMMSLSNTVKNNSKFLCYPCLLLSSISYYCNFGEINEMLF